MPRALLLACPTDKDFGNKMPQTLGVWRTAHDNRPVQRLTVGEQSAAGLPITVEFVLTDM